MLLGILSAIPLLLAYLPPTNAIFNVEIVLFSFHVPPFNVEINVDSFLLLRLISTAIGLIGGFIVYCYIESGTCQEKLPQLELLVENEKNDERRVTED